MQPRSHEATKPRSNEATKRDAKEGRSLSCFRVLVIKALFVPMCCERTCVQALSGRRIRSVHCARLSRCAMYENKCSHEATKPRSHEDEHQAGQIFFVLSCL